MKEKVVDTTHIIMYIIVKYIREVNLMAAKTKEERIALIDEKIAKKKSEIESLEAQKQKLLHPISMRAVMTKAKEAGFPRRKWPKNLALTWMSDGKFPSGMSKLRPQNDAAVYWALSLQVRHKLAEGYRFFRAYQQYDFCPGKEKSREESTPMSGSPLSERLRERALISLVSAFFIAIYPVT